MNSAIYEGTVHHRRHAPVQHRFSYGLSMMYLDLAEVSELFKDRWLWSTERRNLASFQRRDYHGSHGISLDEAVRSTVRAHCGEDARGPIRLLTHLRYWGYSLNPVSFYYCFDESGTDIEFILAEITNTPWRERYAYVLDARAAADTRFRLRKRFHISPFMDMDMEYDWRFNTPGDRLAVHMTNLENGSALFDATLTMQRKPLNGRGLARVLVRYPAMSLRVAAAIYWQAARLRMKGIPFYAHPSKRQPQLETTHE